jgi:hypothetical protein
MALFIAQPYMDYPAIDYCLTTWETWDIARINTRIHPELIQYVWTYWLFIRTAWIVKSSPFSFVVAHSPSEHTGNVVRSNSWAVLSPHDPFCPTCLADLIHGPLTSLWQWATPVIFGLYVGPTWAPCGKTTISCETKWKVKITPEQVTKTQMRSRSTALL